MITRLLFLTTTALAALCLLAPIEAQGEEGDGVEVQARGQVHEAFAEASASRAAPGVVVSKAPPAAIEEMPPEEKPEGDHVVWIPGYWTWSEEGDEFMWVSGFWRAVPPRRAWVPGHWQKVSTGHQWVSGYWSEQASAQQVMSDAEYLPPPPDTLDVGPSTQAPGEEYTYVPGIWVHQTRYVWRPGYWVKYRPGWVWVPACYKWTPCGYVYVSGYWDMPLCERGFLYAPVRFVRPIYLRRGYVYRPLYVVQPDFLVGSLFVRNTTRTYYFGNYFEPAHRKHYVPWVDYRVTRGVHDVNLNYYRSAYVKHASWERNLRGLYAARYANDVARPPVTLVQQNKLISQINVKKTTNVMVHKDFGMTHVQNATVLAPVKASAHLRVTAMSHLAGIKDEKSAPVNRTVRVETASKQRLQEERNHAERIHSIARERNAAETKYIAKQPKEGLKEPVKIKVELPKTIPTPRVFKPLDAPPMPTMPAVKKEPGPMKK